MSLNTLRLIIGKPASYVPHEDRQTDDTPGRVIRRGYCSGLQSFPHMLWPMEEAHVSTGTV